MYCYGSVSDHLGPSAFINFDLIWLIDSYFRMPYVQWRLTYLQSFPLIAKNLHLSKQGEATES